MGLIDEFEVIKKKVEQHDIRIKFPFVRSENFFGYLLSDTFSLQQKKWFINKKSFGHLNYWQNLDNPKSFNEKTNWYKLHYQDPLITRCADKCTCKDFVNETIGEGHVCKLLGEWNDVDKIDFESLPQKFVLKSTWGSGSRHVIIVQDKKKINKNIAKLKMANWLNPWENVYYESLDWAYKNIMPRIIAEEFMEDRAYEYDFFCFNGEPKFLYVAKDSSPGERNYRNFYDIDWNILPVRRGGEGFPYEIKKPDKFEEMIDIAKKLSAPFPHVRVDLVDTSKGIIVVEMTFYTGSGEHAFDPVEWDYKFGEYFDLPEANM